MKLSTMKSVYCLSITACQQKKHSISILHGKCSQSDKGTQCQGRGGHAKHLCPNWQSSGRRHLSKPIWKCYYMVPVTFSAALNIMSYNPAHVCNIRGRVRGIPSSSLLQSSRLWARAAGQEEPETLDLIKLVTETLSISHWEFSAICLSRNKRALESF